MLDGNIFVVFTAEDKQCGLVAFAQKIPRGYNLASMVYGYNAKSLNVCKTWKDAKELEKNWNESFKANGSQK